MIKNTWTPVLIAVTTMFLLFSPTLLVSENVELEKAKSHYRQGEPAEAISILNRLIQTKTLSPDDNVAALEWLTFCYLAKQQDNQLQSCFYKILNIKSSYEPREAYLNHKQYIRAWLLARKQVLDSYIPEDSAIKTVAILDFDNNSIDDAERLNNLGKGLSDILITNLSSASELRVVERENIQFIMDEIRLNDSTIAGKSLTDKQYAVRIGKLLGAQSVIFGSFMKLGKQLRIDVRLVKTETGEILKTSYVSGKDNKILELSQKLALKLCEELEIEGSKKEIPKPTSDIPLEAGMAYSEALSKLDEERYCEALEMLTRAIAIAPGFDRAKKKHEMVQSIKRC